MYKLENDVPMPSQDDRSKFKFLDDMKVGQSFVVPNESKYTHQKWRNQFMYRKWKCSIRKNDDNNTLRVWRTA
jgi:hypothetical protein